MLIALGCGAAPAAAAVASMVADLNTGAGGGDEFESTTAMQPLGGSLVMLKVLDGLPIDGKFWVFYGALSNVAYTITVTDTQTGAVRTYTNPAGNLASVADTGAF